MSPSLNERIFPFRRAEPHQACAVWCVEFSNMASPSRSSPMGRRRGGGVVGDGAPCGNDRKPEKPFFATLGVASLVFVQTHAATSGVSNLYI